MEQTWKILSTSFVEFAQTIEIVNVTHEATQEQYLVRTSVHNVTMFLQASLFVGETI